MKLIQKILSHGLLIAFIVAAFFIYMNRVELLPQWFAKPAPATAGRVPVMPDNPVKAAADVPVPEAPDDTRATLSVEVEAVETATDAAVPASDTVVVEAVTETPAGESVDTREQVSTAAVEPDVVQQEPDSGNAAPVFRPLEETAPPEATGSASEEDTGSQQAAVDSTPEQEPVGVDEQIAAESEQAATPPAAAGQEQSDYQAQLELARAWFWRRDIRAALRVYQGLADTYPERAEIWGEMGNLYFNIRNKPAAMNAYAHAIKLLIEQGDEARARALLNVMYRLDARRASQFEMRLRQTGG